jgi:histone-lysine N-methyltransferase SETMAR
VTSACYSEMQCEKLKPAIQSKRCGLLSKGAVLLHDNAHPHADVHTVDTLTKLIFGVQEHSLYSPDLAPSDSHLFGPHKEVLRGCQFTMH